MHLTCGNAEETPYPDASFDAVYGSSILHHLDPERALREVSRLLRAGRSGRLRRAQHREPPGGGHVPPAHDQEYFGVSPDERAFSRFRAAAALHAAGLSSEPVRPFDFLHPATPERFCGGVSRVGRFLERLPLVRELAGSLLLVGRKP